MAQGLGVRPTAGPRRAGRAGGAAAASERALRAAFSDASAVFDAPSQRLQGASEAPSGPDLSVFSIAGGPAPNHVR